MGPGMGRFAARHVLTGSGRSRLPGALNVLIAVLNGEFPGHIPKLPKSEVPSGSHIPRPLTKKPFWVSGATD
jgi:hypothetical protein